MNTFIIKNVNIVTEYGVVENGLIYVKRGIIQDVGRTDPGRVHRSCNIIDGMGGMLLPGFIDIFNTQLAGKDSISFRLAGKDSISFRPAGKDVSSFYFVEKALYHHGITSVFHMIPDCENTDGNKLNQLRRMGIIRHHFISKLPALNSFRLIGATALSSAMPTDIAKRPSMHIICSDNSETSILQGVYAMCRLFDIRLEEAVGMISINPARALGIEGRLGSVEWGKRADLVLADNCNEDLIIRSVFVSGCIIYDRENSETGEECNRHIILSS